MHISRRQSGFSLLEVLIAIIVLSIGLLGHSKIQALGVRAGTDAHLRTEATFLANDMIERMRSNRPSVASNYYAGINYGSIDCTGAPAKICSEGTAGAAAVCTSAEMADEDAFNWTCDVTASLPGGSVAVTSAAGVFTVAVNWNGLDEDGNVQPKTVTTTLIP
ncbi:MAG: type IV pilus modification protein PilV [Pseudomonadota bacterium]